MNCVCLFCIHLLDNTLILYRQHTTNTGGVVNMFNVDVNMAWGEIIISRVTLMAFFSQFNSFAFICSKNVYIW